MALKYVHHQVKAEAAVKKQEAKARIQADLALKLEGLESNALHAAQDERELQPELKSAVKLVSRKSGSSRLTSGMPLQGGNRPSPSPR